MKTKKENIFWIGVGIFFFSLMFFELTILLYIKEMFYFALLSASYFGVFSLGMLVYMAAIVFSKEKKK